MPLYRVQQTIQTVDNVAANYATNTWHFFADNTTALALAVAEMQFVYKNNKSYMSALVRTTGHAFKAYNLSDPEPRAPVLEGSFDFSSSVSGDPLPPEVSLVLSFQAEKVSGVPQARKRNRIYFPFLNESANHTDGRPLGAFVTSLVSAGANLLVASDAASTWAWTIFSTITPVIESPPVSNGWVDNEWDTQRRRGREATSRSTFT
jgi:hypothetical protein